MSFKRVLATMLILFVGVSSITTTQAYAKEDQTKVNQTKEDNQVAEDAQATEDTQVTVFSMSDVISDDEASYVTIAENQTPLAATNTTLQSKDETESAELVKKEEAESKKQQQEEEKKAKKEYKKNLRLLAAIIYCEAGGQCYAGRLAVGAVVMNRVNSSGFPNTVKGVIWQPYQFGPVRHGKMARELKNYDNGLYNYPERSGSLKAAKDILAGKYIVKYNGKTINLKKYTNFNGHLSNAKIRISGHDFA